MKVSLIPLLAMLFLAASAETAFERYETIRTLDGDLARRDEGALTTHTLARGPATRRFRRIVKQP